MLGRLTMQGLRIQQLMAAFYEASIRIGRAQVDCSKGREGLAARDGVQEKLQRAGKQALPGHWRPHHLAPARPPSPGSLVSCSRNLSKDAFLPACPPAYVVRPPPSAVGLACEKPSLYRRHRTTRIPIFVPEDTLQPRFLLRRVKATYLPGVTGVLNRDGRVNPSRRQRHELPNMDQGQ
ncbi:hypothetical protein CORC01_07199 [Colletotrichum orchidophilum]|uniref:Uncharacterized protein n=1 Tax=Colletotrichum orchidophilum TaxID=1209926 RepID=A0A1G4B878_9PEZI|nr:uncharacterized protein CORC01_07199 [Colletotrichum orchidophilum]OHE97584.1 hypothetical protein CORC01_07199 [Colletotrichum orchidophilum]